MDLLDAATAAAARNSVGFLKAVAGAEKPGHVIAHTLTATVAEHYARGAAPSIQLRPVLSALAAPAIRHRRMPSFAVSPRVGHPANRRKWMTSSIRIWRVLRVD